jgi:hypothetical protein
MPNILHLKINKMKVYLVILILFVSGILQLTAQNYFDKFGSISQAEIDMTSCSYDPTADAVVLFDVGESSFFRVEYGFNIKYQRITRVKILSDAGLKYAEVLIPFYQEGEIYEKVDILKASTYTISDGRITNVTALDPKTCYQEKVSEHWKQQKFAMPDVKPGSIIEYVYEVTSQYFFNLRDWEFQWSIPVLYSQYETRMVPFYEYTWSLQGKKSFDYYDTYEDNSNFKKTFYSIEYYDMVYKFGMKNNPAFVDEEFIPSREDFITKLDFQLSGMFDLSGVKINIMTTWPDLVKDYEKHSDFGRYVKKSGNSASKILDPDSLDGKTQMQKFQYIVNYAKNNFKWNSVNSQFADKSPSDLIKDKIGNSAEINLWLVGALQEAGFEAYPVILSTRSHGKIQSDYPFSSSFNFVVAYAEVDGNPVLADATDPLCPDSRISIQCMNDKGLLVDKDKMKWFSLQSPALSQLITSMKIDSICKDQTTTITTTATDYEALWYRNKYAGNKDNLLEDLRNKKYTLADSSLKIRFASDRTRPFTFMYVYKSQSENINDKIYIKPFQNEVMSENKLKQKTRTYPVDLIYPVKRIYKSEIIIPEGYKVEFLPDRSTLDDDLFSLDYTVSQNADRINVSFEYSFKHSVYSPGEYSRVKALFDRIVKKGSEKIVLVKT